MPNISSRKTKSAEPDIKQAFASIPHFAVLHTVLTDLTEVSDAMENNVDGNAHEARYSVNNALDNVRVALRDLVSAYIDTLFE